LRAGPHVVEERFDDIEKHGSPLLAGSTRGLNRLGHPAQVAELHAAGAAKVFHETASGARTDRAQLALLLKRLEPGDTVLVTRLDRLARSTRDLLNTLHALAERGVGFRSLVDTWAATRDLRTPPNAMTQR